MTQSNIFRPNRYFQVRFTKPKKTTLPWIDQIIQGMLFLRCLRTAPLLNAEISKTISSSVPSQKHF